MEEKTMRWQGKKIFNDFEEANEVLVERGMEGAGA